MEGEKNMSALVLKHFELTRGYFIKQAEAVSEEVAQVQPDGFPNTILWQIGHVLTLTEQIMFGFPHKTTNIPARYLELFGSGTKPADWKADVPTVGELIVQLKDQLDRVKQIPVERFKDSLEKPILGLETFGELAGLVLLEEAQHMGQIKAMVRVIEQAGAMNR